MNANEKRDVLAQVRKTLVSLEFVRLQTLDISHRLGEKHGLTNANDGLATAYRQLRMIEERLRDD